MIVHGDLFTVLPTLAADSIDACVCDPPYGLEFMGKEWDKPWARGFSALGIEGHRQPSPSYGSNRNPVCVACRKHKRGSKACHCADPQWDETDAGNNRRLQDWHERWAREVFRVLKPGAHLVAFGGTRTHHRLMCGLEDAGFEIRDCLLYWGFATGFPKSRNVSADERFCQCPKERGEQSTESVSLLRQDVDADNALSSSQESVLLDDLLVGDEGLSQGQGSARNTLHGLRSNDSSVSESPQTCSDADVFVSVQRGVARTGVGEARAQGSCSENARGLDFISTEDERSEQSGMEGRSDVLPETWELQADQIRAMPGIVSSDGSQGWLRDGASVGNGAVDASMPQPNGSRASSRSRSAEQHASEHRIMAEQPDTQARGVWPLCDRCGKSVVPKGLGTGLKPAYEPIVLARKPLAGTIAATVGKHGTGALNIDAARIGTNGETWTRAPGTVQPTTSIGTFQTGVRSVVQNDLGRWPANVVLSHSVDCTDVACVPECPVRMLDEQSGDSQSPPVGAMGGGSAQHAIYGEFAGVPHENGYGDFGGASRFLFVAKPSRAERDLGCEALPPRLSLETVDREPDSAGAHNPRAGAGRGAGAPVYRCSVCGLDLQGGRAATVCTDGAAHRPTYVRTAGPVRNHHPTVKSLELMRWLVRLVVPPGGTCLDCFMGSGTTGMACRAEQREFVGIERDASYIAIAEKRIAAIAPLFYEDETAVTLPVRQPTLFDDLSAASEETS